jgi:chromatin segregation and condensation protein Rec8/ScpA/Scc1 (kleisin family)
MARLEALLAERAEFGFQDAVGPRASVVDVLSTFVALLELARRGALTVEQREAFAPIRIRRESPREAA